MNRIFSGFLFVFLDFNLSFNQSSIDVIPDFIGFILIVIGLNELLEESDYFSVARTFAMGMAFYSTIEFVVSFLGISFNAWFVAIPISILITCITLYTSYNIVQGIGEIEDTKNINLDGNILMKAWKGLAITKLLSYALIMFPVMNVICIFIAFGFFIVFLFQFNTTKNAYNNYNV